jgi:hypothetical protein
MGNCQTVPLRPQFGLRLRLEFPGANVTSDAGLLVYRELDDTLQLTGSAASGVAHHEHRSEHTPQLLSPPSELSHAMVQFSAGSAPADTMSVSFMTLGGADA